MTYEEIITNRSLSTLKGIFKNLTLTQETREKAFLEYTARFYHSGNRAADESGCYNTPRRNSPGCAFGQHLPPTIAHNWARSAAETILNQCWEDLPEWMKEMDSRVFVSAQSLHDTTSCWNSEGLSEEGRLQFVHIWKRHFIDGRPDYA